LLETALLDVRVMPWRPRRRVLDPDRLRENADPLAAVDDLPGVVIALALWLLIVIAAPLVVLVLAVGLLSVELPLALGLGLVLVVVRFTGLLPWTVVIVDHVGGHERRESYRNLLSALRRIRAVNGDRRVRVRWAWA
jgi:hypothetical protein